MLEETQRLNLRQQRFVDAYLLDPNGKQAAIAAGYSPKAAEVTASKMLRMGKVSAALRAARAEVSERAKVDAQWVLEQLIGIAESAGVTIREKLRALELVGKHIEVSAFQETVLHQVSDDLVDLMIEGRKRVAARNGHAA